MNSVPQTAARPLPSLLSVSSSSMVLTYIYILYITAAAASPTGRKEGIHECPSHHIISILCVACTVFKAHLILLAKRQH